MLGKLSGRKIRRDGEEGEKREQERNDRVRKELTFRLSNRRYDHPDQSAQSTRGGQEKKQWPEFDPGGPDIHPRGAAHVELHSGRSAEDTKQVSHCRRDHHRHSASECESHDGKQNRVLLRIAPAFLPNDGYDSECDETEAGKDEQW